MSYFDDSSSDESSRSLPEDPLERILMMNGDEDGETTHTRDKPTGPLSPPPESAPPRLLKPERDDDDDKDDRIPPTRKGNREPKDKPLTDEEIVAQIIAQRLAAIDQEAENDSVHSSPQDPLQRILQMEEEENGKGKPAKGGDKQEKPDQETSSQPTPEQQIVARIIAMRLAAIDAQGEGAAADDESINSNPEDPLVRIMNMKAEDTLASAMALMQFEAEQNQADADEWDEYDSVLQKRDIFDMNAMIEKEDLHQLEQRAGTLARIMKRRLGDGEESDDSVSPNDTTMTSEADKGYLALVKDAVNRSYVSEKTEPGLSDSDFKQPRQQFRYVSMTGSILDGVGKPGRNPAGDDSSSTSTLDESDYFDAEAVASPSPKNKQTARMSGSPIKNMLSPGSPRKKLISSNVDVSFSDWWGVVGDLAGIKTGSDTFSDSQSNLSYVSSTDSAWTDSVTSMEASANELAYEASPQKETRKVGKSGIFDFNGIQSAIRKFETSSHDVEHPEPRPSLLEEKRRKKRELEAWKTSISRSMHSTD